MRWTGRQVTVLGAGVSGLAACQFLIRQGARVFLSDAKTLDVGVRTKLQDFGVAFEEGGHTDLTLRCDAMVVSPGIPPFRFPVAKARRIEITVYTEVELGIEEIRGPIIAVTGTNGKSTVATLIHHLLPFSHLVGNIGQPLSTYPHREGIFVMELSSFQLAYLRRFRPRIAILLNLAPDHLDWHRSVEAYYQAKLRIFQDQTPEDEAILNADDPTVVSYADGIPSKTFWFSTQRAVHPGIYLENHHIHIEDVRGHLQVPFPRTPATDFYQEDLLPAILAAYHMGEPMDAIVEQLKTFHGLPHRLEYVLEYKGVLFINDSKATNPHATRFALKKMDAPVVLILGGDTKGVDLSELREAVHEKVRALIAIGENRSKIAEDFGDLVDVQTADSMREAVQKAFRIARPGDIVLLSPACASFDWFQNYKDRGRQFRDATRDLVSGRF